MCTHQISLAKMSAPLLKDNVAASLLPHDTPSELIPIRVSGDGNCLFHAVKVALAATEKCLQVPTVSDLRRNCTDKLEKNTAIYTALIARHGLSVSVSDGDTLHPGSLVQSCLSNAALTALSSAAVKRRTVVNFKRCFVFLEQVMASDSR